MCATPAGAFLVGHHLVQILSKPTVRVLIDALEAQGLSFGSKAPPTGTAALTTLVCLVPLTVGQVKSWGYHGSPETITNEVRCSLLAASVLLAGAERRTALLGCPALTGVR